MIAAVLAGKFSYIMSYRPYERSVYVMALSYMKNEQMQRTYRKEASLGVSKAESFPRNPNSARGLSVSRSTSPDSPPQAGSVRMEAARSTSGRKIRASHLPSCATGANTVGGVERAEVRNLIRLACAASGYLSPGVLLPMWKNSRLTKQQRHEYQYPQR